MELLMRAFFLVAGLGLAATPTLAAPKSVLQSASEFAACKWTTARAGPMSLSGFDCKHEATETRLVGDAGLPGFWLETRGQDGVERRLALRTFVKPAKAGLTSILPEVKKASPGSATASCVFVVHPARPYPGARAYALEPTGEAGKAFQAGDVDEPCGELGVGQVGDRYFYVAKGRPDTVVMVDMGSEIQPFDPATLTIGGPSK